MNTIYFQDFWSLKSESLRLDYIRWNLVPLKPDGKIIQDRKTGKPRAKQNKENYEKFTNNLSEFVKDPKSEKIEPQYRKDRENEQDAVGFLNRKDRRFVIFDRHTKKYITGWVMNDIQYQEFINNNNII